jgi:hypothetical protein
MVVIRFILGLDILLELIDETGEERLLVNGAKSVLREPDER